jgi:selenocysteine lyase/cysteine desulfurase
MNTLLMVAVVLIALAVIAQAGVLIAMYLMSRRLATKAETLMNDGQRLMVPLESITSNLKAVSEDLTETGKIARAQAVHLQEFVSESQANIRRQISEVSDSLLDSIDEARSVAMRPIRQYSALAMGISEAIRTLLFGRKEKEEVVEEIIIEERQHPAA